MSKNIAKFSRAQVLIEFTFCMIIVFLMVFAIIMVLRWTGIDLAGRNIAHESQLTTGIFEDYGGCVVWRTIYDLDGYVVDTVCDLYSTLINGPIRQIDRQFYLPAKMNAVWGGQ